MSRGGPCAGGIRPTATGGPGHTSMGKGARAAGRSSRAVTWRARADRSQVQWPAAAHLCKRPGAIAQSKCSYRPRWTAGWCMSAWARPSQQGAGPEAPYGQATARCVALRASTAVSKTRRLTKLDRDRAISVRCYPNRSRCATTAHRRKSCELHPSPGARCHQPGDRLQNDAS